jgi:hypothetical protein
MYRYCHFALCFLALAPPAAQAQERAYMSALAADANAPVAEARYDSAFTGYQPFREQKLVPWREVNDDVHKAGGHIGIFRGAHGQHGAKPASAAPRQENKK